MTAFGIALLNNSLPNPQLDLASEELSHINSLITNLTIPYSGILPLQSGFTGYSVCDPINSLHTIALFTGQVFLAHKNKVGYFQDTIGLASYLHLILGSLVLSQSAQETQQPQYIPPFPIPVPYIPSPYTPPYIPYPTPTPIIPWYPSPMPYDYW